MMGAVRILSRVFRRSRWREYRRILEAALDQGGPSDDGSPSPQMSGWCGRPPGRPGPMQRPG